MTWLDSLARTTRYAGPKLRLYRSRPEPAVSSGEAWDECSMAYMIESSTWRDSRVRDALEYLLSLEKDPDADEFAIVWARHELQRSLHAAKEAILLGS